MNQEADVTDVLHCSEVVYNPFFQKSILNDDEQSMMTQTSEEVYKNTKSTCLVCEDYTYPPAQWHSNMIDGESWNVYRHLDLSGKNCEPVPLHCRYSLPYLNDNYYKSINPFYEKGFPLPEPSGMPASYST